MADETKPEGSPGPEQPKAPDEPKAEPARPAAAAPPKPPAAAKPAAAAAAGAAPKAPPPPKAPAVMVTTPWADELTARVKTHFGEAVTEFATYLGQSFMVVRLDVVPALLDYLKGEEQFDYLVDITAVDWPKREARFDLIYVLYSFARNQRIRVKTYSKDGDRPRSVVDVHLTADWLEREVFDMFGIEFTDHPGLKRILMPDEWQGYPLRKDYGITAMDNRWVQENLGIESGQ